MLSGVVTAHLDDGISNSCFVPLIGNFLSDSTPSNKSIMLYTSSSLKLTVEIYIVYTLPTDILVNAVLNLKYLLKSEVGEDVELSNSKLKISPFN